MNPLKSFLLALALTAPVAANAATCPSGDDEIRATSTVVTIGRATYDVRGPEAGDAFSTMLRRCGQDDAADLFQEWRSRRRTTVTSLAAGTVLAPLGVPGLVSAGVIAGVMAPTSAARASATRRRMVRELTLAPILPSLPEPMLESDPLEEPPMVTLR